ncbi:MAG: NAD(+) synthase [Candidatus Obscuribacterales bacterium]|nr:NAD(+) synthase [Candidatus Obscuribacterales bacterium]
MKPSRRKGAAPIVGLKKRRGRGDRLDLKALLALADKDVRPTSTPAHGFVRIAAASPKVVVADCRYNAKQTILMMERARKAGVHILNLPELGLTSYTCGDLFHQQPLRSAALAALDVVCQATKTVFKGIVTVGLPLEVDGVLYNCAVAIQGGKYLGVVPKSYLPTGGEFDEERWFASGLDFEQREIVLNGQTVLMGTNLLFTAEDFPGLVIGLEVCEDGWAVIPPHRMQALGGATVLVNLSASNDLVGKADFRVSGLVVPHSAQCMAVYAYTSSGGKIEGDGAGESTTDMTFGGHCLIGENGSLLANVEPFSQSEPFAVADVDIDHLLYERIRNTTFRKNQASMARAGLLKFEYVAFKSGVKKAPEKLLRYVDAHPFVPSNPVTRDKRCHEIFQIQVSALAKRMAHIGKRIGNADIKAWGEKLLTDGKPLFVLGVSGGLDSTWALIVACKMLDNLGLSRKLLHCYTLPGFGTTNRTYDNALKMMKELGVTWFEVDIKARCLLAWQEEGYMPFGIDARGMSVASFVERLRQLPSGSKDLAFENKQARARTDLLMSKGFVLGTGDLSELAAGWCTYNADHMSMYGINAGIPKTLVHFLVRWAAEKVFEGELAAVFVDVTETEVSPELLPPSKDGKIAQKTNASIGPADLRDFYFHHIRRWGANPEKIVYLAKQAKFNTEYSEEEIRKWLAVFITRFFDQRYKHSCLPDGSKVGSASLSPRYDWHMASDSSPEMWLTWAEVEQKRQGKKSKRKTKK